LLNLISSKLTVATKPLECIGGERFKVGKSGILTLNIKTSTAGGRYILLVDVEKS
jgi:hypothetical protein